MKNTYYFSHDYNHRTLIDIKRLIRAHGMLGYGVYWAIIEDLFNNANAMRMDCESIAFDLRVDEKLVKSVLNDFTLFNISDVISSDFVKENLELRQEKSKIGKAAALARWADEKQRNANAMPPHNNRNADGMPGKEIKGKEKKEKERKVFIAPALQDVVDFFVQNGYKQEIAKKAFDGYNVANWCDSRGKKIINWKQKMLHVWFREEHLVAPSNNFKQVAHNHEEIKKL